MKLHQDVSKYQEIAINSRHSNHYLMLADKNKNPASFTSLNLRGILSGSAGRKRHLSWEEADFKVSGLYTRYIQIVASNFSTLTLIELKICALIKSMKGSWEISDILGISEHTVENHRVNIRKKIGVQKGSNLVARLAGI